VPHLGLQPTPFELFDQGAELFNGASSLYSAVRTVSQNPQHGRHLICHRPKSLSSVPMSSKS
jgi:hypothetical protein